MGILDVLRRRFGGAPPAPPPSDEAGFNVWGDRAKERQNADRSIIAWTDSPLVMRRYIHPVFSGHPDGNWLDWARRRFFGTPADLVLDIGCGDGGLDRHALAAGLARRIEAFDASTGAVEVARQLARTHGIHEQVEYAVADLNVHSFAPRRYDAAVISMAVHHIRELEHFFAQLRRALKPGGLLIMNEFVGPNQFQWTRRQMKLADKLLLRIPERYRRSLLSGHVKIRVTRQTIERMNEVDPTEAIRSADIIPLMRESFEMVEQVDYGGTLLNLVLEEIAGNFEDTPEDVAVLESLFAAERDYLKRGVVSSDFTVLVARNPA